VIGFVLVLAASSITSTLTLKDVPPSGFVGLSASGAGPQSAQTMAYWDVAVRVIQWKYPRGTALPEQVPEEFRRAHASGRVASEDSAARVAYWSQLREAWLRSENWQTTFKFQSSWPIENALDMSREFLRFIRGA
jgi:hypothetical protein